MYYANVLKSLMFRDGAAFPTAQRPDARGSDGSESGGPAF